MIAQRMTIDQGGLQKGFIEHYCHALLGVVDGCEKGHRPRSNAEVLHQRVRRSKGQPSLGSNSRPKSLEIDPGLLTGNDKEEIFLAVPKKQILGMDTRDISSKLTRFIDGMNGGMLVGLGYDATSFEIAQDFFASHYTRDAILGMNSKNFMGKENVVFNHHGFGAE